MKNPKQNLETLQLTSVKDPEEIKSNLFPVTSVEAVVNKEGMIAEFPDIFIPNLEPGLYGFWLNDISDLHHKLIPYLLVFEIVKSYPQVEINQ